MIKQDRGTPFSVTNSGTSVALATQSGTTSVILFVTDISASSSSTMGTWALFAGSPTGGSDTALWRGSGAVNMSFTEAIAGLSGGSVYLSANGTVTTYANVAGFSIKAV